MKILSNLRNRNNRVSKKPGSAPGTVEHTGERHMEEIQITVHDYDDHSSREVPIDDIKKVQPYLNDPSKTWIRVNGLHEIEKLKTIWSYFDLHPLIQEDIVNTSQRPKVEFYDNCIFFVLRMIIFDDEEQKIKTEQISIVLGKNYVLSFQETDQQYFKPILERLAVENGRIRSFQTDYLTYALIDAVVDYYFKVIEDIGDHIEAIEEDLLDDEPDDQALQKIHTLRRQVSLFRKSVWPLRDAINSTIRDETEFISDSTKIYLRDVYDHIIQIMDNIESQRDIILGLHDMYMSNVSNKMNEVMKVLTIIATIFIPLTFIAGLYGMNFNPEASPYNLPELNWYYGYPASLVVMVIVAVVMIIYFKKKGWF